MRSKVNQCSQFWPNQKCATSPKDHKSQSKEHLEGALVQEKLNILANNATRINRYRLSLIIPHNELKLSFKFNTLYNYD